MTCCSRHCLSLLSQLCPAACRPLQAMRDRSLLQAVAAEFVGVMLFQLLAGTANDQPLQAAFTFAAISE